MKPARVAALHGAILLLALVASLLAHRPRAAGQDESPGAFSATRARRDLERIARAPHPVGSDEHARVRDHLLARLGELASTFPAVDGRRPEVAVQAGRRRELELQNLLLHIPGRLGADAGALLLAAHYDARGKAPGAADDGAACASWLETLRALATDGVPTRDLLLLLTDGEELGLQGARLFAEQRASAAPGEQALWNVPLAAALNFEAIGNDGPSVLFQTGPEDGVLVDLYRRSVSQPVGSSLAPWIYGQLPNDTDLSVFREMGLAGLNFAIVGGGAAYHRPFDTPANLSDATLAHQGRTMLALVRAVQAHGDAPLRAPSRGFQDFLGVAFATFPARTGRWLASAAIILTVLSLLLVRERHALVVLARGLGRGLLTLVVTLLVAGLVVRAGIFLGEALAPLLGIESVPRGNFASVAVALAAALVAAAGATGFCGSARERVVGTLLVLALAGRYLAHLTPEGAHALALPTLLATAASFALQGDELAPWRHGLGAACAGLAIAASLPLWHLLVQVLGTDAFVASTASALFAALVVGWAGPSLVRLPARPLVVAGLSVGLLLAFTSGLLAVSGA